MFVCGAGNLSGDSRATGDSDIARVRSYAARTAMGPAAGNAIFYWATDTGAVACGLIQVVKRGFDILVSGLLLVAFAPLLVVVALCVRAFLGRPVLYRQLRPGIGGKPFELVKFRTMRELRDADGLLLPDEQRMSGFGSILRRSSIDELPELWSVLRGDMSLVGPRPLLLEYLSLYTPEQKRRHEVRPGITGWAQVNGRNAISWEERFALDVWYVDNRSFLLDLRILFMTLGALVRTGDVSQEGHVTMEKFRGSKQ